MIFKEGKSWIGAALEFNIVLTGDDPRVVEAELNEAVLGYIESVKKMKGIRPEKIYPVLNQKSPEEYEKRWATARKSLQTSVLSPLSFDMYKFGIANLATA